jgi:glycosyltransferase involved in cell wall biosynthesis
MLLPLMGAYHRHLVKHATMAFFQGRSCYDYYAAQSPNPQLVYDTHTTQNHFISETEKNTKYARVSRGEPLRLIYAGRAAPMKGAVEWMKAMIALKQKGIGLRATWLGDGESLPEMQAMAKAANLDVELPGHVTDREFLLKSVRESDLFVFCHKTPESPRCLIEALVSGTPIVGYESAYAAGLLEGHGGGALVPDGATDALAETIAALDANRAGLIKMMSEAAVSGQRFDEGTVYRTRATLLRRGLRPPTMNLVELRGTT